MQTHLSLTNHWTHPHTFTDKLLCMHKSFIDKLHTHSFHGQITAHTHTHTHFKLKTNLLQLIRWWCGQELQDWCRALHCCHCTPATQRWIVITSVTVTRSSFTHTHAHTYTCTHTHMHAHTHTQTHTYACTHTHTHTPHSSSDAQAVHGPMPY